MFDNGSYLNRPWSWDMDGLLHLTENNTIIFCEMK